MVFGFLIIPKKRGSLYFLNRGILCFFCFIPYPSIYSYLKRPGVESEGGVDGLKRACGRRKRWFLAWGVWRW